MAYRPASSPTWLHNTINGITKGCGIDKMGEEDGFGLRQPGAIRDPTQPEHAGVSFGCYLESVESNPLSRRRTPSAKANGSTSTNWSRSA
jgi:hypothetical protein